MLAAPASGDSIVNFLKPWNLRSGSSSIQVEAGECLRRESAERRFGLYRIWHLKWGGRFWKTLPSVKSFALECVDIVRQRGYLEAVFAKFTFKAVAPRGLCVHADLKDETIEVRLLPPVNTVAFNDFTVGPKQLAK